MAIPCLEVIKCQVSVPYLTELRELMGWNIMVETKNLT